MGSIVWLIFFFQAEDGIRDWSVTGVQTCALPIYDLCAPEPYRRRRAPRRKGSAERYYRLCRPDRMGHRPRSEERRVGKECRSRWWPESWKKKEGVGLSVWWVRDVREYWQRTADSP